MKLLKLTSARKVQMGLIILLLAILGSNLFAYIKTADLESNLREIDENYMVQLQANIPIKDWFATAQITVRDYQIGVGSLSTAREAMEVMLEYVNEQLSTAEDPAIIHTLEQLSQEATLYIGELELLSQIDDEAEYIAALREFAQMADSIDFLTSESREQVFTLLDRRVVEISQAVNQTQNAMLILLGMGLLISLGLTIYLTKDLQTSAKRIKTATKDVVEQSEQAASASQQVAASAEESRKAMEEARSAVEQVSQGTNNSSATVQEVSSSINEISSSIQQLASGSQNILEAGKKTFGDLRLVDSEIKKGKQVLKNGSQTLRKLEEEISNIGGISDTIMQITDQTNLLALNAAIEAARAGEHGRGFSVVAEEVRKLAEESKEATESIKERLTKVREASRAVVGLMIKTESQKDSERNIVEVFDVIDEASTSVTKSMESAVDSSQQQAEATSEASAAAEQISAAAEELAAQLEQSSAGAEEMTANVQQVLSAIGEITDAVQEVAASAEQQAAMAKRIEVENNTLA